MSDQPKGNEVRSCPNCHHLMMTLSGTDLRGVTIAIYADDGDRTEDHYERAWRCELCGRIELTDHNPSP
jgi:hypothetical protein